MKAFESVDKLHSVIKPLHFSSELYIDFPIAVCRCRFVDKTNLPFAAANYRQQKSAKSAKNTAEFGLNWAEFIA